MDFNFKVSAMILKRLLAASLCLAIACQPCFGWSEGGHHLIAKMAFDLLPPHQQAEVRQILARHPRLTEDFRVPRNIRSEGDVQAWTIGRAGYWPDVARSQPQYDRPTWHYQLGSTLTIGDSVTVPSSPGPLLPGASLATQELHLAQAVELCRNVLRDKSRPEDRAVALCWLLHLVGDSHQPCHAGSLYYAGIFPEGDRGANGIPTVQGRNVHAVWDNLLGPQFDPADSRRRAAAIQDDATTWNEARQAASETTGLDPLQWLKESNEYGRSHVYTVDVLNAVEAAKRSGTDVVAPIDLPEEYLKSAGALARKRAAFAVQRLALILQQDLEAAH